jgi:hypothetical protein
MTILNKENSSIVLDFLATQSTKYLLKEKIECLESIERHETKGDKNHKGKPCIRLLLMRSEFILESAAKVELINKVLKERKV